MDRQSLLSISIIIILFTFNLNLFSQDNSDDPTNTIIDLFISGILEKGGKSPLIEGSSDTTDDKTED